MKLSEAFEGEDSSLRKAFDQAVNTPNTTLDGETCDIPHHDGMHTPDTEIDEIIKDMKEKLDLDCWSPECDCSGSEKVEAWLRTTLTSRDTSCQKRTRKQYIKNQQLKKGLRTAQKTISKLQNELATRDTCWKERVRKVIKTVTPVYQGRGAHLREIGGGEMKKILLQALDNLK